MIHFLEMVIAVPCKGLNLNEKAPCVRVREILRPMLTMQAAKSGIPAMKLERGSHSGPAIAASFADECGTLSHPP